MKRSNKGIILVVAMIIVGIVILSAVGITMESDANASFDLEKITDGLYYDVDTNIVYFWNGNIVTYNATMPTVKYAPNGLPYKYDAEKHEFYEIDITIKEDR